jgi:hypothetical protein
MLTFSIIWSLLQLDVLVRLGREPEDRARRHGRVSPDSHHFGNRSMAKWTDPRSGNYIGL